MTAPIDWNAMQARIELAGDTLEVPPERVAEVLELIGKDDEPALTVLLRFARNYGLSLDWLVEGDVRPMLRYAAHFLKQH